MNLKWRQGRVSHAPWKKDARIRDGLPTHDSPEHGRGKKKTGLKPLPVSMVPSTFLTSKLFFDATSLVCDLLHFSPRSYKNKFFFPPKSKFLIMHRGLLVLIIWRRGVGVGNRITWHTLFAAGLPICCWESVPRNQKIG